MAETELYRVILLGDGQTAAPSEVRAAMARLFRLSPEKIEQLFLQTPVVVKKNVGREVAEKLVAALTGCGARAAFEPMPLEMSAAEPDPGGRLMTCPACGQSQPEAQTCIFCGKVVAKVLGAMRRDQPEGRPEPMFRGKPLPELDLRPMTVLDMLARSFTLLRRQALALLGVAVVAPATMLLACAAVLGLLLYAAMGGDFSALRPEALALAACVGPSCSPISPGVFIPLFMLAWLAYAFIIFWEQAALTCAISESHLGQHVGVVSSYRSALGRMPSLMWTSLTTGLMIGGALLVLMLPSFILGPLAAVAAGLVGAYLALRYVFLEKVVVLEGLSGGEARARCTELIAGNWLRLIGLLLATGLLTWLIIMGAGFVTGFLLALLGEVSLVVRAAVQVALMVPMYAFAATFPAIGMCLFYYDARLRNDGSLTAADLAKNL